MTFKLDNAPKRYINSKRIGKIKTDHEGSVFYGDGLGTNSFSFLQEYTFFIRKAHYRTLLNQSF
ncbi:hypothetical protein BPJM79_20176 [Bacillus pumilus]